MPTPKPPGSSTTITPLKAATLAGAATAADKLEAKMQAIRASVDTTPFETPVRDQLGEGDVAQITVSISTSSTTISIGINNGNGESKNYTHTFPYVPPAPVPVAS